MLCVLYSVSHSCICVSVQLYSQWLDGQNYVDVTRSSHAKLLYFPLSLFYLSWQHKAIQQFVLRGALPETTQEQHGMEVCFMTVVIINLTSRVVILFPLFSYYLRRRSASVYFQLDLGRMNTFQETGQFYKRNCLYQTRHRQGGVSISKLLSLL